MTDAAAGTDSTDTAGATPYNKELGGEVLLDIYSNLFNAMLLMEEVSTCDEDRGPVLWDELGEIERLSTVLEDAVYAASLDMEMPAKYLRGARGGGWEFPEEERMEKRDRLKRALRDRGLTDKATGEAIGVDGHTVGNWLRGGKIDGRNAFALYRLLGHRGYFGALYGEDSFEMMQCHESHLEKLHEVRRLLNRMSAKEVDAILTIARAMTASHRTDT